MRGAKKFNFTYDKLEGDDMKKTNMKNGSGLELSKWKKAKPAHWSGWPGGQKDTSDNQLFYFIFYVFVWFSIIHHYLCQ